MNSSKFFIVILLCFSSFLQAQFIKEDAAAYSGILKEVVNQAKKRDYAGSVKLINEWSAKHKNSSFKSYVEGHLALVEETQKIFESIKKSQPGLLNKLPIRVGKSKATITELSGETLSYTLVLSSGSTRKEKVSIYKLPALSVFYILKKVQPESYLTDTAKLLILDRNFTSAKTVLINAKKAGKDISQLVEHMKDLYAVEGTVKEFENIKAINNALVKKSFNQANGLLKSVKDSLAKNKTAELLYGDSLASMADIIQKELAREEERRLERYVKYPLKADQHKKISCEQFPNIKYDIYLPPQYDHKGKTLLPIIYTLSPGGGGMVRHFKAVAKEMGFIVVGNLESKNGISFDYIKGSWYAMVRDIQRRVHFDPSRQFTGGMSGGAATSYIFGRSFSHHISGTIAMGGWLGGDHDKLFHWYREGFLAARTNGDKDGGANAYLGSDRNHLEHFKATVKDWKFPGGHISAPQNIQKEVFKWFLSQRPASTEQQKAQSEVFYKKCKERIAKGEEAKVLIDCLDVFMEKPYSWHSLKAQFIFDDIMQSAAGKFNRNSMMALSKISDDRKVLDTLGFNLYASGLIGDGASFKSLITCFIEKEWIQNWVTYGIWPLAASKYEDVKDPKLALQIIDKIKKPDDNVLVCKAAALASLGQKDKAQEVFKKISKNNDKISKNRLEALKKML